MTGALTFPKPRRLVDVVYLAWIRARPCLICGAAAHAHHTKTVGAGGSDYRALPFCPRHHDEQHRIGIMRFSLRYKLDIEQEVIRHLELYISSQLGRIA